MAEKQKESLTDIREHVLYCGVTMTGKTTLARHHAAILARVDYDVAVYDPVGTSTVNGGWPEKAKIITDVEEFAEFVERSSGEPERPLFLFVDESADIFGHSETWAHYIPRKCRHQNIYLRLIVQRPKMLHPSVRTQCAFAYMLRLSKDDAKTLAADFGHSAEVADWPLDKGDCLVFESGRPEIVEFNVFRLVDRKRQPAP